MRKYSVPAGIIAFFLAASPVFAAGPFGFTFGDFLKWFGIRSNGNAVPSAQPTLPVFPTEAERNDNAVQVYPGNAFENSDARDVPVTRTPTRMVTPKTTREIERNTNRNFDTGLTGTPKQNREKEQERNQNAKPTRSSTPKNDKSQKMKDIVDRMLNNYLKRINNYVDFLKKVESRRDKLADEGKDVTNLDAFIKTAKNNLAEAQTILANAKTSLASLDYTQNPGDIIKSVKDETNTIREALTTLHKSMSETVKEIVAETADVTGFLKPTQAQNRGKNEERGKDKFSPDTVVPTGRAMERGNNGKGPNN